MWKQGRLGHISQLLQVRNLRNPEVVGACEPMLCTLRWWKRRVQVMSKSIVR